MNKYKQEIIIILAMSVWGGTWVANKVITQYATPQFLGFLKFFIAFICLIPFAYKDLKKSKITLKFLLTTFLTAMFLLVFNRLLYTGLKIGYAGIGGIIVSMASPLFTYVLVAITEKKRLQKKDLIALLIGIIGGAIIIDIVHFNLQSKYNLSLILFFIASFVWSLFAIFSRKSQENHSSQVFMLFLYGFITLAEFLGNSNIRDGIIIPLDLKFILNILHVSVLSLIIASRVFFNAAKNLSADKANSYTMLVPIFALFFGFIILNEPLKINIIIGGTLSIFSVYMFNKNNKV